MIPSTTTFWILLLFSFLVPLLSNIVVVSAFTSPSLAAQKVVSASASAAGADQRFKIRTQALSSLSASPSSDDNKNNSNNDDDIFLGIKNFFTKLTEDNSSSNNNKSQIEEDDDEEEEDDDELPAGTILLLKINATQLKPGGLRLFLMFYLLGMQNTPDKNTWRADQKLMSTPTQNYGTLDNDENDDNEKKKKTPTSYVLEMLYDIDRTGMLQIEIIQSSTNDGNAGNNNDESSGSGGEIRLYRCGSRPSTSYLMQESIIVDGVLEELQQIAGLINNDNNNNNNNNNDATNVPIATSTATILQNEDDDDDDDEEEKEEEEPPKPIANKDRLLIPDPLNAIEIARESLAFG